MRVYERILKTMRAICEVSDRGNTVNSNIFFVNLSPKTSYITDNFFQIFQINNLKRYIL